MRFKMTLMVLILILFYSIAMPQTLFNDQIIKSIQFQGLINTNPEEAKKLIDIKAGDAYSDTKINNSLKKLYSLDIFKNAKVDVSQATNGVNITFIVEENIFIRKIKFEGAGSLFFEDLKKITSFTENSYFTDYKANKSIAALKKKLNENGLLEATVATRLKVVDVSKNVFDLTFKVTEGKKVVVEKINIAGFSQIPLGDIKGAMKTKERFFIFISGILKDDEFIEDKDLVTTLYQKKGFMDFEIKKWEYKVEELDKDKHKAIVVYIDISEGNKYYTGKTEIQGNTIFTSNDVYSLVQLKKGDVYDKTKMDLTRGALYSKYSDNGHLYANVSLIFNKDITNRIMDTVFVITEGPLSHIEKVTVSGNTKTQSKVITREFEFKEGEIYIQKKLKQSYEHLMQLQYFSDVKFLPLPGSAEGLVNLDIGVEEQRTGLVSFGVGYGTESGFNTTAQVSEKNLFGTGRTASFGGEFGWSRQGLALSFTEPWLFDNPISAGVSLSYYRNIYRNIPADDNGDGIIDGTNFNYRKDISNNTFSFTNDSSLYIQHNITLSFNLSQRFWVYWSAYTEIGSTLYLIGEPTFKTPLIFTDHWDTNTDLLNSFKNGWQFRNYLPVGIGRNSTDNPLNPLYGSTFNLDLAFFGGILGGAAEFIKASGSYNYYWNPLWKIVFASHVSTEFIFPQFGGKLNYTLGDQLYFDGMYEMRGWQNYTARSLSKIYFSEELRFQIVDQWIWGCFFADLGNLWASYSDYAPLNPNHYIASFGVGIKVNVPMIPIRFYMAKRANEYQGAWYVSGKKNDFFDGWYPVFTIQGLF